MKIGKLRISAVRNESFKDSRYAIANVGESIQSVVMANIYEKCGIDENDIIRIDQCEVKQYDGEEIILPLRLPLSRETVDDYLPLKDCVHPFFISLHLHDDIFEGRPDLVDYFSRYQPIGCRDEITCDFFRRYGIESYIMGCYTLTLPQREEKPGRNKVFMVDVSPTLEKVVPDCLKYDAVRISHATPYLKYPVTAEEDERLEKLATEYIHKYMDEARLVITSRLHAAAPSIAMGIPVVLASDNADFRYAWIDAFLPLYQAPDYDDIDWNPKHADVSSVREELIKIFDSILNRHTMDTNALKKLDSFYRDRLRADYYKSFRGKLSGIKKIYADKPFKYAIWGAGNHCLFAYQLMCEMYPKAKLVAVVDRFKTGSKFGVPIVRGEELARFTPDHVCISTKPGLNDALAGCKEIYGNECERHYTIVTSQQES